MKIIKLSEEHYIIVNDSEIKQGDWVVGCTRTVVQCMYPENVHHRDVKKITHSTQPIEYEVVDVTPTGDAIEGYVYDKIQELSLSEVKELVGVVDVEKRAEEKIPNLPYKNYVKIGFIGGYNQALEDNKEKKWTDEDVIKIVEKSRQTGLTAEYIILSLQPQTEWEVEIVDGKLKLKQ